MSYRRRVPSSAPSAVRRSLLSTLLLVCLLAGLPAAAQEPAEAPAMSEETAARMAAWVQAMTPGPQHEMLAAMAGDWDCEITMWMEPGADPMVEQFTATRRMVFGGRFLEEDVTGAFMGQPFNGRAMTGYDNITGTWWNSWIDDHTTRLMVGEGTWNEESKTWTFLFTNVDPLTGEESEGRGVTRILSADHEVHEMWEERDGESVKSMELVYRRK